MKSEKINDLPTVTYWARVEIDFKYKCETPNKHTFRRMVICQWWFEQRKRKWKEKWKGKKNYWKRWHVILSAGELSTRQ